MPTCRPPSGRRWPRRTSPLSPSAAWATTSVRRMPSPSSSPGAVPRASTTSWAAGTSTVPSTRGRAYALLGNTNIINQTKLFDAVDAVVNPANGQIVCRSDADGAAHVCAPLNIMGAGSPAPAALAYIMSDVARSETYIRQTAAALSIRGELGATWAGPIRAGRRPRLPAHERRADGRRRLQRPG